MYIFEVHILHEAIKWGNCQLKQTDKNFLFGLNVLGKKSFQDYLFHLDDDFYVFAQDDFSEVFLHKIWNWTRSQNDLRAGEKFWKLQVSTKSGHLVHIMSKDVTVEGSVRTCSDILSCLSHKIYGIL